MAESPVITDDLETRIDAAVRALQSEDISLATAITRELLASAPDDYRVLQLGATATLSARNPQLAQKLYKQAIEKAPDDQNSAMSWIGLASTYRYMGEIEEAQKALNTAMQKDPSQPAIVMEIGNIQAMAGNVDAAVDAFRHALRIQPGNPQPAGLIGNLMISQGRYKEALAAYDTALKIAPGYPPALFNRGTTLQMLGKPKEALAAFQQALQNEPSMDVYYQISRLKKFTPDDPDIAAMRQRFEQDPSVALTHCIDSGFGLAKALDDIGEHEEAFEVLDKSNRLMRSTINYDLGRDIAQMNQIKSLFTEDFIKRFAGKSTSDITPIFIIGMPRSGSTLIEQMLSAHSGIEGGGELGLVPLLADQLSSTWMQRGDTALSEDSTVAEDLDSLVKQFTEKTAKLSAKSRLFTDKTPINFLYAGLIRLLFPNAILLHSKRDPKDTCLSNYQRLYTVGNVYSYDLTELGTYYRHYDDMMNHWHQTLPGEILDVVYEDMINNPEQQLGRILDFCGLEFEPACLDFHKLDRPVSTASSVQIREPLYKSSVGKWRVYEKQLRPLIESLQAV